MNQFFSGGLLAGSHDGRLGPEGETLRGSWGLVTIHGQPMSRQREQKIPEEGLLQSPS